MFHVNVRHIEFRAFATFVVLFFMIVAYSAQCVADVITTENGLSSNSVKTIYRDNFGYVYFGTSTGVDRYDGTKMVNISFPDKFKAEKCWVSSIVDVGYNHLLVGNNAGLFMLDKRTLAIRQVYERQIDCPVTRIVVAPDSAVYVSTVNGIYTIACTKGREVGIETLKIKGIQNFSERNFCDLAILNDKGLSTKGGKVSYLLCALTSRTLLLLPQGNAAKCKVYLRPMELQGRRFVNLAAIDNTLYVGTNGGGVVSFHLAERQFGKPFLLGNIITSLQSAEGSLYVGTTENGTYQIVADAHGGYEIMQRFVPKGFALDDLSAKVTYVRNYGSFCFLHDEMGIDWMGYLFFGIDYTSYSYRLFSKYALPGLPIGESLSVQKILFTPSCNFLCTRDGLYVVDRNAATTRHIGSSIFGVKMISDVMEVANGYLVATIGNGVFLLDNNSLASKAIHGQELLRGAYVYMFAKDLKGRIWMATTKGAACYDVKANSIKVYDSKNSQLPDDEVFCLNFDDSGRGWLSTRGGLCCYDPVSESMTTSNLPTTLVKLAEMRYIYHWADGTMCFLPQHGFPVVSDPTCTTFKTLKFDIHENNVAINFFYRHHGNYIFSTEKGLYSSFAGNIRFYGHLSNINGVNMSAKAPFCDKEGMLWICTNDGVYYANIKSLFRKDYVHIPIVLSEIQSDHWFTDSEVSIAVHDHRLSLSRYSSDLRLRFSPLVYGNINDLRYRYRMEGVDKEWRIADNSRTIFYKGLPFGRHKLCIEVMGMPEISSDIIVDVPFTYSQISMACLVAILILLSIHIIYCKLRKKEYFWERLLPKPEKYQTSRLDSKEGKELTKKLVNLMNEEKPYVNPALQMADLAKMLGCSPHTLSQVFSLFIKRNYYDFIAEYRIEEFKRLARKPEYEKYTITALSNLCGFRSRTPFLVAFKKYTGMTPKEWMKH